MISRVQLGDKEYILAKPVELEKLKDFQTYTEILK